MSEIIWDIDKVHSAAEAQKAFFASGQTLDISWRIEQLRKLVKEQGLTLEGAAKQLAANKASVDKRVRALESLKNIREQLAEIRKTL